MRIVAGKARGRVIKAPPGKKTRPTTDRVREAIFSAVEARLGPGLPGVHVLDLFAGSGALGLEALSRGAEAAVFVDSWAPCRDTILANAQALGFEHVCQVVCSPVERAWSAVQQSGKAPFLLVLADPPYATDPLPVLEQVARGALVGHNGLVVLEHAKGRSVEAAAPVAEGSLELTGHKTYGDTAVSFFWFAQEVGTT